MASFNKILELQGVSLSKGMERLVELLNSAPKAMRPVMLRQAPEDAARVLARYILRQRPEIDVDDQRGTLKRKSAPAAERSAVKPKPAAATRE